MSVTHDFSAIENLEREFENMRQEELRSSVEKEMSPLRAKEKEANGRAEAQILQAQAERRKKTGYAALAAGGRFSDSERRLVADRDFHDRGRSHEAPSPLDVEKHA